MEPQDSLRVSILLALGLHGCAGATNTSSSSDGSTSVVTIAPAPSSSATPEPVDSSEPGIPVISSKVGWIVENNGNTHRATAVRCDPTIEMQACAGTESRLFCTTDADCKEHPHGKCVTGMGQVGTYCGCHYSCASDSDCDAEEVCVCKGVGRMREQHSVCARATCRTDAECESKQCGLSVYNNGCSSVHSVACRTKADTCKSDSDCTVGGGQCAVTRLTPDAKWECGRRSCVIGRPLVIEGQTRAALPKIRADWRGATHFDLEDLDAATREAAANHYTDMAAMEHASVASFSRFSLQLMAFGAPAELLRDAHAAALDEIEHARAAYAWASSLGRKNVGPDKLPAALAPIPVGLGDFVKALVEEGCVGETLGAAEGRVAARFVVVPEMASSLATIADDEERHATLAWRTLQWALETFGDVAQKAAEDALRAAMQKYAKDPVVPLPVKALGILSGKDLGTLRREVLATVVVPCAQALGIAATSVVAA